MPPAKLKEPSVVPSPKVQGTQNEVTTPERPAAPALPEELPAVPGVPSMIEPPVGVHVEPAFFAMP